MATRAAIIGGGKSGLDMAFWLKVMYQMDVVVFEKRERLFGRNTFDLKGGHNGPSFLHRNIHQEEAEILRACAQDPANWKKEFCVDYDAAPETTAEAEPEVEGMFAGTRWFDHAGQLNSEEVDAGVQILKKEVIPGICSEGLAGFDLFRLTKRDRDWDNFSLADWANTRGVPGLNRKIVQDVSPDALKSFIWTKEHDNGRSAEEQSFLMDCLLNHANGRQGGYYNAEVEVMIDGGLPAFVALEKKLRSMGVEFRLNTEATVHSLSEPTVYFTDGRSEKFDFVIFTGNPTDMPACLADSRLTTAKNDFFSLVVNEDWAKRIGSGDVNCPEFESWFDFTPPGSPVLKVFMGGNAFTNGLPWARLKQLFPEIEENTTHISRGNLADANSGSLSCLRKGNIDVIQKYWTIADHYPVFAALEALAYPFWGYNGGGSWFTKIAASRLGARY
jgi:hypothetical protein